MVIIHFYIQGEVTLMGNSEPGNIVRKEQFRLIRTMILTPRLSNAGWAFSKLVINKENTVSASTPTQSMKHITNVV